MKHLLTTILLLLTIHLSPLAQIDDARRAINEYRFFDAECILNDIPEGDSLYAEASRLKQGCKIGANSLNAIERVQFVDSIMAPASTWMNVWRNMPLSAACGTIAASGTTDGITPGTTRYTPAMADRFYTSRIGKDSISHIYVGHYGYNGTPGAVHDWALYKRMTDNDDFEPLTGLMDDDADEINPFVMADGLTLYFASRSTKSIGGYDIFMTRYDIDEHRFLSPQNVGMPFNSPANDLFYAIDEENNIGWLVTDRNMPADTVCIYSFIPNTTRLIYDANVYGENDLIALARIDSIPASWQDSILVADVANRLETMRTQGPTPPTRTTAAVSFVINQRLTYHSVADFKNAEARKRYAFLVEGQTDLAKKEKHLANLRNEYAKGKKENKDAIIALESDIAELRNALQKQEKDVRRIENEELANKTTN